MSREEAFARAKEAGLDLIEIVPTAKPPVARIMSFDKFRYQKEKEAKKERLAQKTTELKHIQVSARAADNDVQIKIKQLEKFLAEGHPIEIRLRLRGREKGHKEWAFEKMNTFLSMITTEYKVMSPPKVGGFGLTAQIIKK